MKPVDTILYTLLCRWLRFMGAVCPARRRLWSEWIGRLLFAVNRRHRRIALQNLLMAFGREKTDEQRLGIARGVFVNLVRIVFEIGWYLRSDTRELTKHFTITGLDDFARARSKGKGVLFLTAHLGNWELLPVAALLGRFPVSVVYRPLDNPFLDRFLLESRSRFGARTIPTHRGAMRRIYRELRSGYPVAMLLDQNMDWYEGVFVDFFKHRACTSKGMALMALKSGAPVLPAFLVRCDTRFHVAIGPELPLIRTGDPTKDVEMNTEQYNRVIELYVRRFPDQWFWVHQRWKTRPYQPWPRGAA
jgi:KDO2-lipid IV(A) lauroyltransferase